MKKLVAFASVAVVALSAIFAQAKIADNEKTEAPMNFALPEENVIIEYHEAQLNSARALFEAKVKAGVCTQELAEARLAVLKARQSNCRGECILFGHCGGHGNDFAAAPHCAKKNDRCPYFYGDLPEARHLWERRSLPPHKGKGNMHHRWQ